VVALELAGFLFWRATMTGIIYFLLDPRTDEPRYVGKTTKTAAKRLNQHIVESNTRQKTHKAKWIQKLIREGCTPDIKIVERADEEELNKLEKKWIAELRKEGHKLTNGTDGGEGISGRKHSEATKEKLRQLAMGRPASKETREKRRRAMTGKTQTPESNQKRSRALKGDKNPMYGKTGDQNPMFGRKHSEESKRKMSETRKRS